MPQDVITKCRGLVTQYNPLSTAEGSLIQADEAVMRRENVIENRRGYATYNARSSAITQMFVYNNRIQALSGTSIYTDTDGLGTLSAYGGTYTAPSGYKIRSC